VSIVAQAAGSVVYAVGRLDGVTRTFPTGQTQDVQLIGTDLDTFWVQRTSVPIAAAGALTFTTSAGKRRRRSLEFRHRRIER
jgi:hypothetical protein